MLPCEGEESTLPEYLRDRPIGLVFGFLFAVSMARGQATYALAAWMSGQAGRRPALAAWASGPGGARGVAATRRWGVAATALMALLSPLLARFLHIPTPWPLWAASLALLLLFLRPVTDGVLQGTQQFFGLGAVQMLQSLLRLIFAAALLWLGLQAAGAVVALPLGSTIALGLALVLLRPYFRAPTPATPPRAISWRYSAYTCLLYTSDAADE